MNITGIKPLPVLSNTEQIPLTLPAKNSVVSFSILDKTGNDYKILINGKVYLSSLPVNAKQGDSLLGVVLNNNPMVLNLVNILNMKSLNPENLLILISKLGLRKTENNVNLLKAFIINKKPILKDHLDKFSEILEGLDFLFDESQLSYLIMVFANDLNFQSFDKNTAEYFRHPLNEIIKEIFSVMQKEAAKDKAVNSIYGMMSVDCENGDFEKKLIANLFGRDKLIAEWISENKNNLSVGTQRLISLFSRYLVQKGFLAKEGIFPGFVIAIKREGNELTEYKIEKTSRDDGSVHYLINLSMRSFELGDIFIDGLLSKSNLTLNFSLEGKKKRYFEEDIDGLKNNLNKNLGLNSFLSFNNDIKGKKSIKKFSVTESINFKA